MVDIPETRHRQPRQFRRNDHQLTDYDNTELRRRYRFSLDNIEKLTRLLEHRLVRPTRRNRALTPQQQVMIALRFYASGNFLQVIGDTFGVDVATVSRVVTTVTDGLTDLKDRAIKFPTTDSELSAAKQSFYGMRGFPSVVGLIDGTHVKILAPSEDQQAYMNRKRQHSINVQATCDHKGRITSINVCWPGSCHDAHIFRSSNLCRHLEENHPDFEKGVLLGDSGYPCRPFLLTPYPNPANANEERYNFAHTSTRNLIERVFGLWKRKFHVLHSEIRMKPLKASKVIVACAVLYNLSILWGEPQEHEQDEDDQPQPDNYDGPMDDTATPTA